MKIAAVIAALGPVATAQFFDFDGPSTTVFSLPFFVPFASTIAGNAVSGDTEPATADVTIELSCRDASCPGPRTASYTIGTRTIAYNGTSGNGFHCPISTTSVTCTVTSNGQTTTRTDNIATLVPLGSHRAELFPVATAVTITSLWDFAAPLLGLYGGTTPLPTVFATNPIQDSALPSIGSVISSSLASRSSALASSSSAARGSSGVTATGSAVPSSTGRSSSASVSTNSGPMTSSASAASSAGATTAPMTSSAAAPSSTASAGGNNAGRLLASDGGILGAVALLVGAIAA